MEYSFRVRFGAFPVNFLLRTVCIYLDAIEVIRRADSGETFTLVGHELTVSKHEPPPTDPYKLFIRNIAETTTKECIINFIASRAKSEAADVKFGETPGTVMVCFDKPPG